MQWEWLQESKFKSRLERTQDAMTTMGVSIIAGAMTTLMSGSFLFGAVMSFFNKFGFIICFTIFSSFAWSMFFFPVVCALWGPEDHTGDVAPLISKLHAYAKARFTKESTSDDSTKAKE
ncbi:hypothetical protein CYMTET_14951 [Cymbomonas tetramitiformis]|uniref:SSD domain-containing protein n=1 Tax=Cymbomonas tetramitiformis TaxID=36881 RepID=A0AAE0GFC6_9CHLO|nr:hypothetical protein CYMTET_14951 [Cymbomonas tetramitiformis]